MIYRLKMYDSGGDGWQSAVYELQNPSSLTESNEGVVVASGTLASGFEGSDWLCLTDGCYELIVGGGSADSEIGFEFLDEVRILKQGGRYASLVSRTNDWSVHRLGGTSKI